MGVKRPLKPQVVAKYGSELAQAEKLAEQGYNPKTKKLDESIYGPTKVKFDPLQEMEVLHKNMVTDDSFIKASQEEFEAMKLQKPQGNMINNALDAVQMEDPAFPMPEGVSQQTTPEKPAVASQNELENNVDPEEEGPEVPENPEERLNWVAGELAKMKPGAPNAQVLREWKRIHGNVFILPIDEYVFIYRYLKRQEWTQLQVNEEFTNLRQDQQEDYIVRKCLLWPQFSNSAGLPAGAVTMLAEQIRIQSMFLDPVQVANLTVKL
jgi:hypothetical protein